MKKYKVVFAVSYEIEAEDEDGAYDKAETLFIDENKEGGIEIFGVHTEEM